MCRSSRCNCGTRPTVITPEARTARLLAFLRNNEKVMEAYLKGAVIQAKTVAGDWHDVTIPNWRMSTEYRVKPKPVEFAVWEVCIPYTQEATYNDDATSYDRRFVVGERSLTEPPVKYAKYWRVVRVKEVL